MLVWSASSYVRGMSVEQTTAPAVRRLRQAREPQEAVVRWLRLLAPVALIAFVAAALRTDPGPGATGRGLVVSQSVAAFVVGVLGRNATVRRPHQAPHIAFVAVLVVSSISLLVVQPRGPGAAGVLLAALCGARLLPVRVGVPVLVAAFIGLQVAIGLAHQGYADVAVLGALGALYGLLLLAFRLAEANKQAEHLLGELRESHAAQARMAGLAERQRLAREMHDVLAHSLSGMMLQLEGARMLAAENPADPRLPQAISRAHQLGKTGLDEARRAIGTLRDDELPGPDSLPSLVTQFEQDRNISCRLVITGAPRPLDCEVSLALYRVAQEALTNITKHACPDRVELRLAYEPSVTRLVVEDIAATENACHHLADDSSGYGLTGMRERAALLGGTLATTRTPNGFRLELDVPT
jgi:signal transduction histidine kinase